ncbi:unnamed protein product [Rotaria magnacalcarata]|uniref:Uncharacterized protein n=1 Tax=Rotaria magnacalcarata TaxID=392030 RepID=A0A820DEE2_9BILA|nr:unnamed protein product [Rotaria magnacalcarata]CAF3950025.1 unnamed protein product [Rotaria magnacalcarata]CAF4036793.1 unnamed protein product [Rotaria magnacalcarata]CAF4230907.1 unnamed protein product [Rotaria magnacalcarata]
MSSKSSSPNESLGSSFSLTSTVRQRSNTKIVSNEEVIAFIFFEKELLSMNLLDTQLLILKYLFHLVPDAEVSLGLIRLLASILESIVSYTMETGASDKVKRKIQQHLRNIKFNEQDDDSSQSTGYADSLESTNTSDTHSPHSVHLDTTATRDCGSRATNCAWIGGVLLFLCTHWLVKWFNKSSTSPFKPNSSSNMLSP